MMQVSLFNSAKSKKSVAVEIIGLFEDIKSGIYKDKIEQVRRANSKEEATRLKASTLPAIAPAGLFQGGHAKINLVQYSQLLCLDFDNLTAEQLQVLRATVEKIDYTFAHFISPSGNGLKVFVFVNTDANHHGPAWKAVKDYYEKATGLKVDESGKDISRLCFISYDPGLYCNELAEVFAVVIEELRSKNENVPAIEKQKGEILQFIDGIEARELDITEGYSNWRNLLFVLADVFAESGREHAHRISRFYPGYVAAETDKQFTACLNSTGAGITPKTFFDLCHKAGIYGSPAAAFEEIELDTDKAPQHVQLLNLMLSKLKSLNFYARNGFKEVKRADYIVITIEEILNASKANGWQLAYKDKQVYLYNGEYWKPLADDLLKHFLSKAALKLGVAPNVAKYHKIQDELLHQFYASAFMPAPEKKAGKTRINLINGTFTIQGEKQSLETFSSADFLTYQLPFAYDKKATCPLFDRYLQKVLPCQDKQKVLQEFAASIFIDTRVMKLEKVLVLLGDGANGKSVFSDVVRALLGEENVSSYSVSSLCADNSYTLPQIQDKLLNYATEFSGKINIERFKGIATGEPQGVRRIYREPYLMKDYARLAFNCNQLPQNTEQTEGFFRRFLIVEFDVKIPELERDLGLAARIIDSELAGVFNWVLEGLNRLLKNGKMTSCEAVTNATTTYRRESDSVASWMDEINLQPGAVTNPQKELYNMYRIYCREYGYREVSDKNFSKRLKSAGFEIEKKTAFRVVYCDRLCSPFDAL